ncbi:MAG TPA: alkaline phosphatase family protein, partial [Jatrophihabitantaceae bacterium]
MPATAARTTIAGTGAAAGAVPHWDHVVVVVLENKAAGELVGNPAAPFLNQLAHQGALFTHSYAITHPSEPNYLALFSGSTHG